MHGFSNQSCSMNCLVPEGCHSSIANVTGMPSQSESEKSEQYVKNRLLFSGHEHYVMTFNQADFKLLISID